MYGFFYPAVTESGSSNRNYSASRFRFVAAPRVGRSRCPQYFVLVTQAKKGMGLAEGNALVEKAQGKTFGAMLHQMTRAGLLSSELEHCFTKLLSERYWLVHKSRSHSRNAVYSDPAMQKIILRLDAMAEESNTLLKRKNMRGASCRQL